MTASRKAASGAAAPSKLKKTRCYGSDVVQQRRIARAAALRYTEISFTKEISAPVRNADQLLYKYDD
ncbi:hypothetical protein [Paraburkholderia caballeronis]|uniref:hypothetical protein n=1 Tax=Paraburkholderia caballeronis TaxID=416943 RepID=UPI00106598DE|nr:hypothetical protein [Paraburkholderia caballeronis]